MNNLPKIRTRSPLGEKAVRKRALPKQHLARGTERKVVDRLKKNPFQIPPSGVKECPTWPGYFAAPDGSVWSNLTPSKYGARHKDGHMRNLTAYIICIGERGYKRHSVVKNRIRKNVMAHAIVADAFHGPRPEGLQIRHLDSDSMNNCPENLAYGTRAENDQDKVNLHREKGYRSPNRGFTDDEVRQIRKLKADGMSGLKIAAIFGCHSSPIYTLLKGIFYSDVI